MTPTSKIVSYLLAALARVHKMPDPPSVSDFLAEAFEQFPEEDWPMLVALVTASANGQDESVLWTARRISEERAEEGP